MKPDQTWFLKNVKETMVQLLFNSPVKQAEHGYGRSYDHAPAVLQLS